MGKSHNFKKFLGLVLITSFLLSSCMNNSKVHVESYGKKEQQSAGPTPINSISLTSLSFSNIGNDRFDISINFSGDDNNNSSALIYYCNETLNTGCSPAVSGDSTNLNKNSDSFTASITGLVNPSYNRGDFLNVEVVVTDVDGVTDTGLTQTFKLMAPVNIFRSVGPGNTSALANGAGNNLTISNGVATFASALPDNIGVGDVIQYDASGLDNINAVIFISGRNSSTEYTVQNTQGDTPANLVTPEQDWAIYRAYTSMSNAENGDENTGLDDSIENFDTWSAGRDLILLAEKWNFALYADARDTTPLVVDDWNSNEENYLKFYTPYLSSEVGSSQRHEGIWDNTKFISDMTSSNQNVVAHGSVILEGIQFEGSSSDGEHGINFSGARPTQFVLVKNNILRRKKPSAGTSTGIFLAVFDSDLNVGNYFIVNNIVYGFTNGVDIVNADTNDSFYFYNNTFALNGVGFNGYVNSSDYIEFKNNLIVLNDTDYDNMSIDNAYANVSTDSTSPNSGFRNTFVELNFPEAFDMRLKGGNFNLIGAAEDLSANSSYSFNDDITGRPRARWDIGAYTAPRAVYRSVGTGSTSSLQNGSGNNLSITVNSNGHTMATIDNDLNPNLGVGDVLFYDPDNVGGPDTVAFISYLIDANNFIVKNSVGDNTLTTTAFTQSWDIYRAYSSLGSTHLANENPGIPAIVNNFDTWTLAKDLVSNNEQLNIAFYADDTDGSFIHINSGSWVTSALNHLRFFTPKEGVHSMNNQRHNGFWNSDKAHMLRVGANDSFIVEDIDHLIVEGFQIQATHDSFQHAFQFGNHSASSESKQYILKDNIITTINSEPTHSGIEVYAGATPDTETLFYIFNNIINGFDNTDNFGIRFLSGDPSVDKAYIYHNTIIGNNVGYNSSGNVETHIKNNIAYNNSAADYSGTLDISVNNLSEDTTASGTSPITNANLNFLDEPGNDFRLAASDTDAINAGADLFQDQNFYPFKDILNVKRTNWDIGAFSFQDYSTLTLFNELGSGTSSDPYQIHNTTQFVDLVNDTTEGCNSSTAIGCDISLALYNDLDLVGLGILPLGDSSNEFSGSIDGNDYVVSNLVLNFPASDDIGLISNGCPTITNFHLTNVGISGAANVGTFIGDSSCGSSSITNSSVRTGSINGTTSVGGFVGSGLPVAISGSYSGANVNGTSIRVGGLVGGSSCPDIDNSYSTGTVTGQAPVGGILGTGGNCTTSLNSVYSTGTIRNIDSVPNRGTGGIVGRIANVGASILNSYSLSDVYSNSGEVGGLIGYVEDNLTISNSWAGGDIKATGDNVGGLIGLNYGTVNDSFALGNVQGSQSVGGLIGGSNENINRSYATGNVHSLNTAGGLVGNIGGGIVLSSWASGSVYGDGPVGGFVGNILNGSISDSSSSGNVMASLTTDGAGGFVGRFNSNSTINRCSTTSDVYGDTIGGFVGNADVVAGSISNSYNKNNLYGEDVGGFAFSSTVTTFENNYSAARLNSSTSSYGFVHTITSGTFNDNYWDSDLADGVDGSSSATSSATEYDPLTTAQFMVADNFDSSGSGVWDYNNTWTQLDGRDYPINKNTPEGLCIESPSASSYTSIGSGTLASPYIICNFAQWDSMNHILGGDLDWDKHFVLGANITFSKNHIEIGDVNTGLSGSFDGRNHIISSDFYDDDLGFGHAIFKNLSGVVKNINVKGSNYNGSYSNAFLVSFTQNGAQVLNNNIEGIGTGGVSGVIAGQYNVGDFHYIAYGNTFTGSLERGAGLVGSSWEKLDIVKNKIFANITTDGSRGSMLVMDTARLIKKSKTFGTLEALNTPGEAGSMANYGVNLFDQNYSHVDINSNATHIGGLAGALGTLMLNSYHSNGVLNGNSISTNLGGLVGRSGEFYHSYANNTLQNTGVNIAGLSAEDSPSDFGTFSYWNTTLAGIVDGLGPGSGSTVNEYEAKTSTEMTQGATFSNWDSTDIWLLSNNIREPLLRWDLHPICQSNPTATQYNSIGSGTQDDPYKICFKEQLLDLSSNGCDANSTTGCLNHYLLLNDIDLKGEIYTPIGDNTNNFQGTFNGNNNTISNLNISSLGTSYVGLFGFIGVGSQIKNLKIKLANISCGGRCGLIAGESRGLIDNVDVHGSITSDGTSTGGIVGYMRALSITQNSIANVDITTTTSYSGGLGGFLDGGTVKNSFAFGDISSTGLRAGGLIGSIGTNSSVEGCGAAGDVDGDYFVGGFTGAVGSGSIVQFSYALGNASGNSNPVGGFTAQVNEGIIHNSFSRGNSTDAGFVGRTQSTAVISNSYSSGLPVNAGFNGDDQGGTFSNNYWDNTVFSDVNSAGEYEGLATGDMDNSTNFNTWNDTTIWRFPAGSYPELIPTN